jgi:hypothetical protein
VVSGSQVFGSTGLPIQILRGLGSRRPHDVIVMERHSKTRAENWKLSDQCDDIWCTWTLAACTNLNAIKRLNAINRGEASCETTLLVQAIVVCELCVVRLSH